MKTGHQKRRESQQARASENARKLGPDTASRAMGRFTTPPVPWDVWMGLVVNDRTEPRGYRQFDGSI